MKNLSEIAWKAGAGAGSVRFALGLLGKLRRYAVAAAPREICGIVIAECRSFGIRIRDVKMLPNIAADPVVRFEIDAREVRAIVNSLSPSQIWGLFHSHTLTDARPSQADLDALRKYGTIHVILSTRGEVRVFLGSGETQGAPDARRRTPATTSHSI